MLSFALYFVLSWNALAQLEECHSEIVPKAQALVQRQAARSSLAARRTTEICGNLDIDSCKSGIVPGAPTGLCRWHVEKERCIAHIGWFHVMKAGSTFGATLAHFANSSLPDTAHMPSCGYMDDSFDDACPGGQQGPLEFFVYKYPLDKWFHDEFWIHRPNDLDPGNHRSIRDVDYDEWKGSYVGIFRQPESRMVSAFNHFCEGYGDILEFSYFTRGTVTKMLSGLSPIGKPIVDCSFEFREKYQNVSHCSTEKCLECLRSPEEDLPIAIERLKGFAFVGLTEEFNASVCLFHVMFGGECLPLEFENMRKGVVHTNTELLAEQLKGHEDTWDNVIYSHVSERFWSNIEAYNVTTENCAKRCPGVDFTTPIERGASLVDSRHLMLFQGI